MIGRVAFVFGCGLCSWIGIFFSIKLLFGYEINIQSLLYFIVILFAFYVFLGEAIFEAFFITVVFLSVAPIFIYALLKGLGFVVDGYTIYIFSIISSIFIFKISFKYPDGEKGKEISKLNKEIESLKR